METIPIRNGINTIIQEGKTMFYHTRSFGSLHDVLGLLHAARQARRKVDKRNPDDNIPEAARLTMYSQTLVPIVFYQPSLLFQPLALEGFRYQAQELTDGDEGTAHYTIDYDGDRFTMASWDSDGLWTVKAPLGGIIDAYGGAVRRHGRARSFDEKGFLRDNETIASIERSGEGFLNPGRKLNWKHWSIPPKWPRWTSPPGTVKPLFTRSSVSTSAMVRRGHSSKRRRSFVWDDAASVCQCRPSPRRRPSRRERN